MSQLHVFSLTSAAAILMMVTEQKPHIMFTLVGFVEAGFRNSTVKTPNFDMLATTAA